MGKWHRWLFCALHMHKSWHHRSVVLRKKMALHCGSPYGVNHQAQYPTPAATPMAALRQGISQLLLFRELIMLLLQYTIFLGNCYFGASKLTYCNIMPMFCVELLLSYSRPSFFFLWPGTVCVY